MLVNRYPVMNSIILEKQNPRGDLHKVERLLVHWLADDRLQIFEADWCKLYGTRS